MGTTRARSSETISLHDDAEAHGGISADYLLLLACIDVATLGARALVEQRRIERRTVRASRSSKRRR